MATIHPRLITMRKANLAVLVVAGAMLAGCVGGTTYGTGVSQEAQTIQDLSNILSLKRKRNTIDYSSRPDLVVPDQKQLVAPQEQTTAAEDPNWPVSPEARIASIRAEAEEANNGSLADQLRYANQDKDFRSVPPSNRRLKAAPIGQGIPNISCDPDGVTMRRCTPKEISDAVRAERRQTANLGSTGTQRRYLTEPPIEYRTPASTAVAGDAGYTEEELRAIKEAEKAKRLELQNSRF